MINCSRVKTFSGTPSNKGYLYFVILENNLSIEVRKEEYSKIRIGDILSYYFDCDYNNYEIYRIFRKSYNLSLGKRYYIINKP